MFDDCLNTFNEDIASWDVGKVTNMYYMFADAYAFNGAIGSWDVGKVTTMRAMFYSAAAFNEDIASWDIGKVTNMYYMFKEAAAFNDCSKKTLADGWATSTEFMSRYGDSWADLPSSGTWVHAGRIRYSICLSLSIY